MTIPITIRRDLTGGLEPAQTFLGATQQLFSPTWPAAIILNVMKCDEAMDSNLRESRFSRILENFVAISLLDLDLKAFSFHFSFSK